MKVTPLTLAPWFFEALYEFTMKLANYGARVPLALEVDADFGARLGVAPGTSFVAHGATGDVTVTARAPTSAICPRCGRRQPCVTTWHGIPIVACECVPKDKMWSVYNKVLLEPKVMPEFDVEPNRNHDPGDEA